MTVLTRFLAIFSSWLGGSRLCTGLLRKTDSAERPSGGKSLGFSRLRADGRGCPLVDALDFFLAMGLLREHRITLRALMLE